MNKILGISIALIAFILLLSPSAPANAASATGSTFTITKAAAPRTIAPNGSISYSITIRNNSSTNAAPQVVTDTLPTGFTYAGNPRLTTVGGSQITFTPTQSGRVLTWTFDGDTLQSIPQNQQIVISYQVTASPNTGTFTNTACLTQPENLCTTENVTVTTNPNTNIATNIFIGIGVALTMIFIAYKLGWRKYSFEQRVLAR